MELPILDMRSREGIRQLRLEALKSASTVAEWTIAVLMAKWNKLEQPENNYSPRHIYDVLNSGQDIPICMVIPYEGTGKYRWVPVMGWTYTV